MSGSGRKNSLINNPSNWGYSYLPWTTINQWTDFKKAIEDGYRKSDTVYSIVKKISRTAAKAPFGEYIIRDEKKFADYQYALKDGSASQSDLKDLQTKSVEPVNSKMTNLLKFPNLEQSGSELIELLVTQRLLTGNSFLYALGLNDGGVTEFHALPPQYIDLITDGQFPLGVAGYQLSHGVFKRFDYEEVIHSKLPNPRWGITGQHLLGQSPLEAAWNSINGNIQAKEAPAEILDNRGAKKLLIWESDKIQSQEQAAAQVGMMKDKLSNDINKDLRDMTAAIYGRGTVHDIGLKPSELDFSALNEMTENDLYNIYGVSNILFNDGQNNKYDNYMMARRDLVQNVVIPELTAIKDSTNRWAKRNGQIASRRVIDFDYTVYSELEDDKKILVDWMDKAPLTENEKRIYLGEEPLPDSNMDKVYVNKNKVPLELLAQPTNNQTNGDANQGQQTTN